MKLEYSSVKVEKQCTSLSHAKKLFGGDETLAISLHSRINILAAADTIKDVILMPQLHFHALKKKNGRDLAGYFAIDVKTRREQWRIIIQPLDEEGNPYDPCNVDEIAGNVRVVGISEVSKHYE